MPNTKKHYVNTHPMPMWYAHILDVTKFQIKSLFCAWNVYLLEKNKMFRLTRKPLICRLPRSCKDMRGSFPSRLTPSFSQLMFGTGSPDAWHFKRATLSTPRVWLAGPWRMMGGGRSVNTERERENVICKPPNSLKLWILLSEVLYYIRSSLKVIGNIKGMAVSRVPQDVATTALFLDVTGYMHILWSHRRAASTPQAFWENWEKCWVLDFSPLMWQRGGFAVSSQCLGSFI